MKITLWSGGLIILLWTIITAQHGRLRPIAPEELPAEWLQTRSTRGSEE